MVAMVMCFERTQRDDVQLIPPFCSLLFTFSLQKQLKNVQMLRRHSSRKKNCSKDSNDDEPEPDVIPAQFNMGKCVRSRY